MRKTHVSIVIAFLTLSMTSIAGEFRAGDGEALNTLEGMFPPVAGGRRRST